LKTKLIKDGLHQLEEDGQQGVGYNPSQDLAGIIADAGRVACATGPVVCPLPSCGLRGHKMKRSHYCFENANNVAVRVRAAVAAADAAAAGAIEAVGNVAVAAIMGDILDGE